MYRACANENGLAANFKSALTVAMNDPAIAASRYLCDPRAGGEFASCLQCAWDEGARHRLLLADGIACAIELEPARHFHRRPAHLRGTLAHLQRRGWMLTLQWRNTQVALVRFKIGR